MPLCTHGLACRVCDAALLCHRSADMSKAQCAIRACRKRGRQLVAHWSLVAWMPGTALGCSLMRVRPSPTQHGTRVTRAAHVSTMVDGSSGVDRIAGPYIAIVDTVSYNVGHLAGGSLGRRCTNTCWVRECVNRAPGGLLLIFTSRLNPLSSLYSTLLCLPAHLTPRSAGLLGHGRPTSEHAWGGFGRVVKPTAEERGDGDARDDRAPREGDEQPRP